MIENLKMIPENAMKVLMISRSTLFSSIGGDSIQILETASHLRKLNVDVDVKLTNESNIDYDAYDIVHFFNVIRPNDILGHLTRINKHFVISTIFVDYEEYEKKNRTGGLRILNKFFNGDQIEYIKALARFILNGEKIGSNFYLLKGHFKSVQSVLAAASCLLPNSHSEYRRLMKKYEVPQKYIVVPNAVNAQIFKYHESDERRDVICVGRIEGRKNQLNLIRAVKGTSYRLYIIGKPSPNAYDYYLECKKNATENVIFVPHVTQSELLAYYKKAKVHVLPSWFETTGLSSLEAGAVGVNLVISPNGDTEEYFKSYVEYCKPDDVTSIRKAIDNAYTKPSTGELSNYILENFTWSRAAEKTLSSYMEVIGHEG